MQELLTDIGDAMKRNPQSFLGQLTTDSYTVPLPRDNDALRVSRARRSSSRKASLNIFSVFFAPRELSTRPRVCSDRDPKNLNIVTLNGDCLRMSPHTAEGVQDTPKIMFAMIYW